MVLNFVIFFYPTTRALHGKKKVSFRSTLNKCHFNHGNIYPANGLQCMLFPLFILNYTVQRWFWNDRGLCFFVHFIFYLITTDQELLRYFPFALYLTDVQCTKERAFVFFIFIKFEYIWSYDRFPHFMVRVILFTRVYTNIINGISQRIC